MKRKEFLEHLTNFFKRCHNISTVKNQDYAKDDDPFRNFRIMDWLGVYDVKAAVLGRLAEKVVRIANVIKAGKYEVKDEPPGETLHDIANLAGILQILLDFEEAPINSCMRPMPDKVPLPSQKTMDNLAEVPDLDFLKGVTPEVFQKYLQSRKDE